jgi:hypothetical protein
MPKIQREPKAPMPAQEQAKPGIESEMTPRPTYHAPLYRGSDKLKDKHNHYHSVCRTTQSWGRPPEK